MEDALVLLEKIRNYNRSYVLILVLMEDALVRLYQRINGHKVRGS